ncbi:MAG: hypothetical protein A3E21_08970 [Sulfurimonas sp. RIFCSPHIGHO2_12_FULL_36_9]|uniref:hypothetical protein n=1 Tax=Sulfurimonas sp. RIFCSPLOWO2_12_36_12 TaxID=1802253 RepID=UPI0008D6F004|nr:hypothetical protein [Sulfurimonas sp. RIFCSPLOWO2_12_36_12]OHD97413.1 MAG: hypothetical protein A3J26_04075 [Sulfurimonas sp. RIFCSPLOWO2_02_FULL_36_28]OHD99650.1 MAG: hypothetical protein A3E21_08970 [Sulfurimonas sp. RIFCSPHIGHO2_12_FULL_36_9]OHE01973.1 MAG: hypothetical protein A2W82_01565 [Sulfurimonas sp. RIFCSPLOWO2_12_36_12]
MIKLLLLFIIPFSLSASKILSYNIYDRTDRVDVMITFDTPYDGVIKQNVSNSTITIKLQNASIESSKVKQLSSKYIKAISITPMENYTQIVAEIPPSVTLQASKTSDAYGLRLRFTTVALSGSNSAEAKEVQDESIGALPTKKDDDLSQSYYIVVTILILGIAALFYIKKRVSTPQARQAQSSWLFQENKEAQKEVAEQTGANINSINNVTIRFQKSLNSDNSVVMLDFGEQSYLVLMGKSNVLLDKFTENRPSTEDDFNSILQNRHKELDSFLNDDNKYRESLRSYKEKAASISYEA